MATLMSPIKETQEEEALPTKTKEIFEEDL